MRGLFPLWGRSSDDLADQIVSQGFRGITCCVDSSQLEKSFVGNQMDASFSKRLPATADPCGENGEFHSFVYDGPIFRQPLKVETGDIVLRGERFYFCDLNFDSSKK
jgi:diphthamide synthase (EF-2-diphthine--ammonia ligase)